MNIVCGCDTDPQADQVVISLPWFSVLECSVCRLWYVDQLLNEQSLNDLVQKHASEEYVKDFAPGYLDSGPTARQEAQFRRALKIALQLRPDAKTLLDAGCGSGRFLTFASSFHSWKRVTGLEISPFLADLSAQKGFEVIIGDVHCMPFDDGSFDVVAMWDVIEHLARPSIALAEIHRVLTPKGVLIIGTPNRSSILHSLARLLYRFPIPAFQKPARRVFSAHPLYFSLGSLTFLLKRNGFEPLYNWQHSVRSEMSFRGGFMELGAELIDSTLGLTLGRRYRAVIVACRPSQDFW